MLENVTFRMNNIALHVVANHIKKCDVLNL